MIKGNKKRFFTQKTLKMSLTYTTKMNILIFVFNREHVVRYLSNYLRDNI